MNGSEGQIDRQCRSISATGKAKTHHRCRLQAGHTGEHVCVVNGCNAGWRR